MAIRTFVETIEGRAVPLVEIVQSGKFVKLSTHSQEKPNEWENFFVWRGRVLAYRNMSGNHVNQGTHAMMMEVTLQTYPISREEWPEPLVRFMEIAGGGL